MSITLDTRKDPMGTAIAEYYAKGRAAKLRVFSSQFGEKFDTILMAMNGIVGKIERLQEFFKRLKQILTPGVQVQLDSFYFVLHETVAVFVVLRYT